jgi:hypothetical protein
MFHIVIFKNNKKKKKLKSFVRENLALNFYNKLVNESESILFRKKFDSGHECRYNIAIITDKFISENIYYTDEYGRNRVIDSKIDENNYIGKISPYFYEELIFDVKNDTRITLSELESKYFKKDKIYMISKLNNKFIIQDDDEYNLFSLKNEEDSDRFLDLLQTTDIFKKSLVVKDISTAQRKYLYNILVESGYNKRFLYTNYTTYPK